jgi:hypothetical protein
METVPVSQTRSIRGVEIFTPGTHNGDDYTETDIDDMISAFRELDVRPAIKVGHTKDQPGAPAYGWVTNLRRVGRKLVADFVDLHDSVYNAVKQRMYDRCSAEIYWNLKRGGKIFRRALKAVALLGAEVPAVAGLKPLHRMEFVASADYATVAACERAFSYDDQYAAGVELDRRIRERLAEGRSNSYDNAFSAALEEDRALARAYAEEHPAPTVLSNGAGTELDARAKRRVREGKSRDYVEAVDAILADDPTLADRYEQERWTK